MVEDNQFYPWEDESWIDEDEWAIKDSSWQTIIAKYKGYCIVCDQLFQAGERVRWKRHVGARHAYGKCPSYAC